MTWTRESVLADTLALCAEQSEDWDYSGELTRDTLMLGDMGLSSIDFVALAAAAQEHYARALPFADLFTELEETRRTDISLGEWSDFVHRHLAGAEA